VSVTAQLIIAVATAVTFVVRLMGALYDARVDERTADVCRPHLSGAADPIVHPSRHRPVTAAVTRRAGGRRRRSPSAVAHPMAETLSETRCTRCPEI
jgi:hypothetical protein